MIPKQCLISTIKGFGKDLQMMIAFFTKEHADTHLGLIINMDWFQPFNSSLYFVGVIYAVICNLPRTERYKSHNILTLAVISGPKELKLHEINNYLYPIINQLVHLWSGYLMKTRVIVLSEV